MFSGPANFRQRRHTAGGETPKRTGILLLSSVLLTVLAWRKREKNMEMSLSSEQLQCVEMAKDGHSMAILGQVSTFHAYHLFFQPLFTNYGGGDNSSQ